MTREELIWEKRIMSMKGSSLLVIKRRDITQFQVPIVSLQMPDEIVDEILENRKLISDLRKDNEELTNAMVTEFREMSKLCKRIEELESLIEQYKKGEVYYKAVQIVKENKEKKQ